MEMKDILGTGNESFGFSFEEEDGTSVSIEQTIEVETEVADQAEEAAEVVEIADEGEADAEMIDRVLAMFEQGERMLAVVEEFGYSRQVAAMFNYAVDGETAGRFELDFGISLPANESLDMVGSQSDAATMEVMDSIKKGLNKFWTWIKKAATAVWEFLKSMGSRVVGLFAGIDKTAAKLATAVGKMDGVDPEKMKDKKFNGMKYQTWKTLMDACATAFESPGAAKAIPALGITIKGDDVVNGSSTKIKTESIKLQGSGFDDASILGNKATIADMVKLGAKAESAMKQGIAGAKELAAVAVRYEKVQDNSSAVTAEKEKSKKAIKKLKNLQKVIALGVRGSVQLAKVFVAAQRAYLACRK